MMFYHRRFNLPSFAAPVHAGNCSTVNSIYVEPIIVHFIPNPLLQDKYTITMAHILIMYKITNIDCCWVLTGAHLTENEMLIFYK